MKQYFNDVITFLGVATP